jgi:riboflavin-specific deaminase-like protein
MQASPAPAQSGPELELRQLLPEQRSISIGELLTALDPEQVPDGELPYTLVNFVATADGRSAFDGRSGPIGDEADRQLFHGLRERVDAVLAGTSTMRVERYGRIARDPARRRRREQAGMTPEPIATLISRSGSVPLEIPLFAEPEARVVVFTPTALDTSDAAAQVEVICLDPGEMTLTTAMRRLRSDYGVRLLLCEGGPTLFGALLQEDLVDEVFLTLSPTLAGGGSGPAVTAGPSLPELAPMRLLWALERENSLFLRYGLR